MTNFEKIKSMTVEEMAEKEYIERGAVIAEIIAEADKEGKKSYDMAERGRDDSSLKYTHGEYCFNVAARIVEAALAVDLHKVVHCQECKKWCKQICGYHGLKTEYYDYCSQGERKENE